MPTYNLLDIPKNLVLEVPHLAGQLKMPEGGKTLSVLTGMMGAGKSTLGRLLALHNGVTLIDADMVAKDTVYLNRLEENIQPLSTIFGEGIFVRDVTKRVRSVDLRKVRDIFFDNPHLRVKFAVAFDPQILQAMREAVARARSNGSHHVIVENAIAIEKGWLNQFEWNHVICTVCSEENQLARLMKRPDLTVDDHRARIAAQFSPSKKMDSASIVVVTNGPESGLSLCADEVLEVLNRK